MKYKIVEKFVSINGEGPLMGQLAVFIRFKGCNLKCSYCDTMWANEENAKYENMTSFEIYNYIKQTNIKNVTLTGGEPLIQEGIFELLLVLAKDNSLNIEIETNGSIDIKPFIEIKPKRPNFTIDYKSSISNMENKMYKQNYEYLLITDCIKFVVGGLEELEKSKIIIEKNNLINKCNVHLSPIFDNIKLADIVNFMKKNKLNGIKVQPQLHKIIWNDGREGNEE